MKTVKSIKHIISVGRRYVLLLEVLISMLLTMILLSVLLAFYIQINKLTAAQELQQEHSFGKLFLSTRLASILPKAVPVNHPDKDYIFFSTLNNDGQTKGPALFFTFDNGVKLASDFSNHVLGKLYLSQDNKLSLAIWPSAIRWTDTEIPPIKNEILFEGVEDLSFSFYLPPSRQRKMVLSHRKTVFKETNLMKVETMGEWKTEWQQEYGDLPALVRLHLTLKPKTESEKPKTESGKPELLVLTYPLPQSFEVIVYEQ